MKVASHDLENVKKRAKYLLRQHRERYFPVAARIREGLPAFAGMSDREVLDSVFALHDAQALIARENGFEDWGRLRENLKAMTSAKQNTTQNTVQKENAKPETVGAGEPSLVRVHPQIFVVDMDRALAYYQDQLGFTIGFTYGEPPFYALVERGAIGLNLRHHDDPVVDPALRARTDLLSAMILTTENKALFLSLEQAGAEFHQRLKEQPWGLDFIVRDPDGNLLCFIEADETS